MIKQVLVIRFFVAEKLILRASEEHDHLMKLEIRLMPDYFCWPLWWMNGDGDIDPHSLPLAPETIERLLCWSATNDATLNMSDPASSRWPSREASDAFEREGFQLWLLLRRDLADSHVVLYQDGGTIFDDPDVYRQQHPQKM